MRAAILFPCVDATYVVGDVTHNVTQERGGLDAMPLQEGWSLAGAPAHVIDKAFDEGVSKAEGAAWKPML